MAARHRVQQGEHLSSVAKQYGFANWRTIYNHPKNDEFKQKRPDPNVLYPDDRIYIPDKELKEESGETAQRHKFRLKGERVLLRLVVKDAEEHSFSGKRYKLEVEGKVYEGSTGDDGLIEHEIPANAERGELTVWLEETSAEEFTWPLKIGHLDPIGTITGVQARLDNLGFICGPVDGINGPQTQTAIRAFQEKCGLRVDGILGPQTQAKLQEVYGC